MQLAIDDSGTGYSNLRFLKQLPIDILKIDQPFVHEISEPAADGVVASAAIAIGSSFQRHVVAEGIENKAQLDFLKAKNCEEGQGFYFCQPIAGKGIEDFLRRFSTKKFVGKWFAVELSAMASSCFLPQRRQELALAM